ncbi:hypothetical protein [Candidatus Thiosymbion oneisti]|uniref:hypothetical protein n=1 Tax=Candidatus Thiosymbion oneisti TaxID=589554 RepID=UPI00105E133D|nr:hypothetical protein [Candidatus Thiosymbion oneisti]
MRITVGTVFLLGLISSILVPESVAQPQSLDKHNIGQKSSVPQGITVQSPPLDPDLKTEKSKDHVHIERKSGEGTKRLSQESDSQEKPKSKIPKEIQTEIDRLRKLAEANLGEKSQEAAYKLGLIFDRLFKILQQNELRDCKQAVDWYRRAFRAPGGHVGACERLSALQYRDDCGLGAPSADADNNKFNCTKAPYWQETRLQHVIRQNETIEILLPEVLIGGRMPYPEEQISIKPYDLPSWLEWKEDEKKITGISKFPKETTVSFVAEYMGQKSSKLQVALVVPDSVNIGLSDDPAIYDNHSRLSDVLREHGLNPVGKENQKSALRAILTKEDLPGAIVYADLLSEESVKERYSNRIEVAAPLYDVLLHLIIRSDDSLSEIHDSGELALTKQFGVLGRRGGSEIRVLKKALPIQSTDLSGNVRHQDNLDELIGLLSKGDIDVAVVLSGYPAQGLNRLLHNQENEHSHFKALDLKLRHFSLKKATMDPQDYPWLDAPVDTVATTAVMVQFEFSQLRTDEIVGRGLARCRRFVSLPEKLGVLRPPGTKSYLVTQGNSGSHRDYLELENILDGWRQADCGERWKRNTP